MHLSGRLPQKDKVFYCKMHFFRQPFQMQRQTILQIQYFIWFIQNAKGQSQNKEYPLLLRERFKIWPTQKKFIDGKFFILNKDRDQPNRLTLASLGKPKIDSKYWGLICHIYYTHKSKNVCHNNTLKSALINYTEMQIINILILSFFLVCRRHVPKHNHFTCSSVELPPSKNQDMRADRGCCVAVSAQRGLPFELSLFPNQFIVSVEDDEVVDVCRRDEVLFSSCAGVDGPPSEEDNIRPADISSVPIARKRWSPRHSHPGPFVFLSIQNADIVQVTGLQLSPLPEACIFLSVLVKIEPPLDDHVCSNLNGCMPLSRGRKWALAFGLTPGHDLEIQDVQVIKVFFSIRTPEDEYFGFCHQHSGMPIPGGGRTNALRALEPGHSDRIKGVQVPKDLSLGAPSSEDDNF